MFSAAQQRPRSRCTPESLFASPDQTIHADVRSPSATALSDFGVEYIELTSPAASEQSRLDCEAICKLGLKVRSSARARTI
ncbi:hypothetical protein IMZ48_48075 [Candidatus Bathyarchaeota archaeon]|nr:hypothetical protein [Candidatus Bathyarchaeota archaeon]